MGETFPGLSRCHLSNALQHWPWFNLVDAAGWVTLLHSLPLLRPFSRSRGVLVFFTPGEYVLLRVPDIRLDGTLDTDSGTVPNSGLSPTTNGTTPQHFAFIRAAVISEQEPGHLELEVYPVSSFSSSPNVLEAYIQMTAEIQARLILLPPLSRSHPIF